MNYIIEQFPEQPVLYMRRIGAYGVENYELMAEMKKWADMRGLFKDCTIYGIAWDNPSDTPPEQCRYDVCLVAEVDFPKDEPIQRGEIPGGKYAVFTIEHTAEAIQEFWTYGIQRLQEEALAFDTSKPILERYQYSLVKDGKCEFCVPIKS